MNSHIKLLTDIAIAAAITLTLTVALLPAAAQEPTGEIAEESQSSTEEPPLSSETTAEPAKTSQTAQTSETTAAETTTENTATTTAAATAPPVTHSTQTQGPSWTEQPASGVMYVNTDGISSVEVAQIGSKKMKRYSLNDAVTVVAFTNTDYYKLEDGTFIHADFLSYSETVTTAEGETLPPDDDNEENENPEAAEGTEAETGGETPPADIYISD